VRLSPELAKIVFWLALATCFVAQLGILLSTARSRAAGTEPAPGGDADAPSAGARRRTGAEFLWALLPAIALVFVFAGTWKSVHQVSDSGDAPIPQHPPATVSGVPTHLAVAPAPAVTPSPARRRVAEPRTEVHQEVFSAPIPVDVTEEHEMEQR
jgi:hypothetical protein